MPDIGFHDREIPTFSFFKSPNKELRLQWLEIIIGSNRIEMFFDNDEQIDAIKENIKEACGD